MENGKCEMVDGKWKMYCIEESAKFIGIEKFMIGFFGSVSVRHYRYFNKIKIQYSILNNRTEI